MGPWSNLARARTARILGASLAIACCLVIGPAKDTQALAEGISEYKVKAAFLYNFVRFVEWPSNGTGGKETVCVLGDDPFDGDLDDMLKGKSLSGRSFAIRRLSRVSDTEGCNVVFISSSEEKQIRPILASLAKGSILTIGDTPGFAKQGCMIEFLIEDNRVRFEINAGAARRANLRISSRLLGLAKIVWE
jgi:hypothetical protein